MLPLSTKTDADVLNTVSINDYIHASFMFEWMMNTSCLISVPRPGHMFTTLHNTSSKTCAYSPSPVFFLLSLWTTLLDAAPLLFGALLHVLFICKLPACVLA